MSGQLINGDQFSTTISKPDRKDDYFHPNREVLRKEALIGPITALNVTTLKRRDGNDSILIFSAKGPWVDLHVYGPQGNESTRCFSYLAFDGSDSGTVHNIKQSIGEMYSSGENVVERKACPWIFYGGKAASFCFLDADDISPFQPIYFSRRGVQTKTHTFSDWVYDIRSIVIPGRESGINILTAVGLAYNTVEIWNFSSKERGESIILSAECLRKIISETRCITYSLSFYGWKPELQSNGKYLCRAEDMNLAVGVGTVMNTILIWNVVDEEESVSLLSDILNPVVDKCEIRRKVHYKSVIHCLHGHDGVIFSTKFGDGGEVIVTTSDDRTIRMWKQNRLSNGKFLNGVETAQDAKSICDHDQTFSLIWTAYGHAARCWDCVFVSLTISKEHSIPGIASVGEDSTVRLWTLDDGMEVANLRGHGCQSIWKIDTDKEDVLVTGGNDGVLKVWYIPFHIRNSASNLKACVGKYVNLVQHLKVPFDDKYSFDNQLSDSIEGRIISPIPTQIMFGTSFYPKVGENKMLLATKSGMVKTLDLISGLWFNHTSWGKPKIEDDTTTPSSVDSASGLSLAIHPSCKTYVIGTSKGEILLLSLSICSSKYEITFSVNGYLAIQEMKWVDGKNLLAFHIKGICILWTFKDEPVNVNENIQHPSFRVLSMKKVGNNPGNIISHYHDSSSNGLYVGDSRGNIAYFDLNSENEGYTEQEATSILRYAHKKEHVTTIITAGYRGGIISGGNDGFIHEIALRKDKEVKLVSIVNRPVPCLTAVTHLWNINLSGIETIVAGGYKGNNFIVLDIISNYQLLCIDTGGRNRRLLFSPTFYDGILPLSFCMVIFIAKKNSQNELLSYVQLQHPQTNRNYHWLPRYSLGTPVHGETILDVSLCKSIVPGRMLLLSGSNDTTIKLFKVDDGVFSLVTELPPHESCIRAVTISRNASSTSALIAASGGKILTTFYRLDENNEGKTSITYLCSTKLKENPSMDHRINAIHAVPLRTSDTEECQHVVLAGDSNGMLYLSVVTEEVGQPRKMSSKVAAQDIYQRPILCIHMIRLNCDSILATTGNTGGDIFLWILSCNTISDMLPESPSLIYRAHQMGANCVKMDMVKSNDEGTSCDVMIVSGGDDQAISICYLKIYALYGGIEIQKLITIKEACASAVKGVHLKISKSHSFMTARVFATGYDQRVSIWELKCNSSGEDVSTKFISSSPVDVKDINAMDSCENIDKNGVRRDYVVAAGEGLELLSLDLNIFDAVRALKNADFLLIMCGAGFSADSGLDTYENMPEKYQTFCDANRLIDRPLEFQQFWSSFSEIYTKTNQHFGYTILERWCGGQKLKRLVLKEGEEIPWYIYSSNVDSHFGKFSCFEKNICEIHGRANEFRCSCSIGYHEGKKRVGPEWKVWHEAHEKIERSKECHSHIVNVNQKFPDSIQKCGFCGDPLRPNVLLFHDTDENVLRSISVARNKYQEWESYVEDQVVDRRKNLVILELGAGVSVPAVRTESEEVISDIQERIKKSSNEKCGSVTFIRINPKNASCYFHNSISIFETAESALNKIDDLI